MRSPQRKHTSSNATLQKASAVLCCEACFSDQTLVTLIQKRGRKATCPVCARRHVKCLPAPILYTHMGKLIRYFIPGPAAKQIVYEDEGHEIVNAEARPLPSIMESHLRLSIFSPSLRLAARCKLMDAIRNGRGRYKSFRSRQRWIPYESIMHCMECPDLSWTADDYWFGFCLAIQERDRFLLSRESSRPDSWLKDIENDLCTTLRQGSVLYRARLARGRGPYEPFSRSEMGAPPKHKARAGRVNPDAIPILYLADSPSTAVAEVRPHIGAHVTIAQCETARQLSIIDLLGPYSAHSPFAASSINDFLAKRLLADQLATAMALPHDPEDSAIAYLPTQYVAEFFRNRDYDGIKYKSAMNPRGYNIALFRPSDCIVRPKCEQVTVVRVTAAFRRSLTQETEQDRDSYNEERMRRAKTSDIMNSYLREDNTSEGVPF